jgi:hypothetical protein
MTTIDPAAESPVAGGPQAGWYHDPAVNDGSRLRWWTGAAWSEHTRLMDAPPPPPTQQAPRSQAAPTPAAGFSTARVAQPTGPVTAQRVKHNGTAWWSFGLGLLALTVVSLVLIGHRTSIWVSSSGVIAIVSGARALRLRSLGLADTFVPAILGIVFGALGTLLMLGMLLRF